jgi:hypothetical protein
MALVSILLAGCFYSYNLVVNKGERHSRYEPNASVLFGFTLFIVAIIIVVSGFICSLSVNSDQVSRSVELTKIEASEGIYRLKADNLTKQFASYLAENYPKYEKDIYSRIEPGKLDLYMVKYPELQTHKTLTELVKQIRDLQDKIYEQQLARVQVIGDMRFAVLDPWVYQWVMPNIPVPEK